MAETVKKKGQGNGFTESKKMGETACVGAGEKRREKRPYQDSDLDTRKERILFKYRQCYSSISVTYVGKKKQQGTPSKI